MEIAWRVGLLASPSIETNLRRQPGLRGSVGLLASPSIETRARMREKTQKSPGWAPREPKY